MAINKCQTPAGRPGQRQYFFLINLWIKITKNTRPRQEKFFNSMGAPEFLPAAWDSFAAEEGGD